MIPSVLVAGLVAGGLIARLGLRRLILVGAAIALIWGVLVGVSAGSLRTVAGGVAIASINVVAGAAVAAGLAALMSSIADRPSRSAGR